MKYFGLSVVFLQIILELTPWQDSLPIAQDFFTFCIIGILSQNTLTFKTITKRKWITLASTLLCFLFFILWYSRWLTGLDTGLHPSSHLQYRTFLHAGLILALFVFFLRSVRLNKRWRYFELTPGRRVLLAYLLTAAGATFALIMPWSLQENISIRIIDSFFISVSALSVTGLSPINVAETFSLTGLSILLFLIQLGGLGIIIISAGLAVITRNRLSLSKSMMGRELYDIPSIGQMSTFLHRVFILTLITEMIGALWIYFTLPQGQPHRMFHSLFHSVSAFCNAGFSSLPLNLETPGITAARIGICALIIIGGLGFPVLFDFLSYLKKWRAGFKQLSSNTILVFSVTLFLLAVGSIGICFIETFSGSTTLGFWEKIGNSVFYSISSRTAGFNIIPVEQLSQATQLFLIPLMIIGGSPISTAGGIKTTTAGMIAIVTLNLLKGNQRMQFQKREIHQTSIYKAITVISLYTVVSLFAVIILIGTETQNAWALTFEVISALSTVGLSLGITSKLTLVGKLILIILMLAGRLGLVTMVYIGVGKPQDQRYRYPPGHFYVG